MTQVRKRPITRGDVYYISFNNAVGSEMSTGRPAIIVESQEGCDTSPTVIVVYLTTREQRGRIGINVPINSCRRPGFAMCNQIATIDKSRCLDYYGTISKEEMEAVDKALATVMGISVVKEDTSPLLTVTAERDYYKNLYETLLGRMVDSRLTEDIQQKPSTPKVPRLVPDEQEELVDLNSASFNELRKVGFSSNLCLNVIAMRPFKVIEDLQTVPGMTQRGFQILSQKVAV